MNSWHTVGDGEETRLRRERGQTEFLVGELSVHIVNEKGSESLDGIRGIVGGVGHVRLSDEPMG